jgi:hypothetical protein
MAKLPNPKAGNMKGILFPLMCIAFIVAQINCLAAESAQTKASVDLSDEQIDGLPVFGPACMLV